MTLSLFGAQSSLAEALNGGQIEKLLIGNTLYSNASSNARGQESWTYFKNKTTRLIKRTFETRGGWKTLEREGSWSVTADGKFCYETKKGGIADEICNTNIRVVGDAVKMDRVGSSKERKSKLLKGNPEGL